MSGGRPAAGPLPERLARHLAHGGWLAPGDRIVVALSGGIDSLVLLHLLRFAGVGPTVEILAAHLDHGMRPESGADAAWTRGLAGAWGVPLEVGRAVPPPESEAEARSARYRFLEEVRAEARARWVLTAHHADDQAETVLFRALRGTGPRGLRGILEVRDPAILRPLLPFHRAELEAYAELAGIRPRLDPTNLEAGPRRNVVRHRFLPLLEEVHPGARAALARLGRLSARREAAFQALLEPALAAVVEARDASEVVVRRDRFLARPPPVRAEMLQELARSLGVRLSEAGTASALEFITKGSSGGRIDLPGSMVLMRDGPRFRLGRPGKTIPPETEGSGDAAPLAIADPASSGFGRLLLRERTLEARWGPAGERSGTRGGGRVARAEFDSAALAFPLALRGRRPGDRAWIGIGHKKVKKLLGELRVPREMRDTTPLLVDRAGKVLWIAGRWRAPLPEGGGRDETWSIEVRDADDEA